jgi:hypothetical protein
LFCALKYGFGAIIAVASLMLILVLPYKEQWIEQFVQGIGDPDNIVYSARDESLLDQILSLKARFSSFGFSFLGWYVGIALIPFLLKGGIYFYIGWIWLIFVMFFIHANTVMALGYCVQFAMGIPILLLMNNGDRFPLLLKSKLRVVIFVAVCVFFTIHHMKLVLSPNGAAMEFRAKEKIIEEQIPSLPTNSKVIGPLEAAVPLLKNGHIYFEPSDFGFSSEKLVKYHYLINKQAEWFIDGEYKLIKK